MMCSTRCARSFSPLERFQLECVWTRRAVVTTLGGRTLLAGRMEHSIVKPSEEVGILPRITLIRAQWFIGKMHQ